MPDQVIHVQPLHDDDDGAGTLVVQTTHHRVVDPVVSGSACRVRQGFIGFERVVDQDQVAPQTRQHPTHRCRIAPATAGGTQICRGRAAALQDRPEQALVPLRRHDVAAVLRMLVGQVLAVTGTDELQRRVAPQCPGHERHRGHDRLQRARRNVDDQALDLALQHRLKLGRDQFHVPVRQKRRAGVQMIKHTLRERGEVRAHEDRQILVRHVHGRLLRPFRSNCVLRSAVRA